MKALLFAALLSLIGPIVCGAVIPISKRLKLSARTAEALLFGALVLPFLATAFYFALRPFLPAVELTSPVISVFGQETADPEPIFEEIYIPENTVLPENTVSETADAFEPQIGFANEPSGQTASVSVSLPRFDPLILTALWLAVAAIALIKLCADYAAAVRALKRDRVYAYDFCGVPVFRLNALTAPMLAGIISPAIYIPTFDTDDITLALRHEIAHLERRDIPKKLILEALGALVWFNPLWRAAKRETLRRAELACDERILKGETYIVRRQYAETIISFAGSSPRRGLAAQLSAGGENLRSRLENIMDDKPAKKRPLAVGAVIAVLLVITAAVCFILLPPEGRGEEMSTLTAQSLMSPTNLSVNYSGSSHLNYAVSEQEATGDPDEEIRSVLAGIFGEYSCFSGDKRIALQNYNIAVNEAITLSNGGTNGTLQRKSYNTFTFTGEDSRKLYYTIVPYTSRTAEEPLSERIRETDERWEAVMQAKKAAVTSDWIVSYDADGTPIYDYPDWWGGCYRDYVTMHIRIIGSTPEIEEYITSRIDMTNVELDTSYISYNDAYRRYQRFLEIYEAAKDDPESPLHRILTVSFDETILGVKMDVYAYQTEWDTEYANELSNEVRGAVQNRGLRISSQITEYIIPDGESPENAYEHRLMGISTYCYDIYSDSSQDIIDMYYADVFKEFYGNT